MTPVGPVDYGWWFVWDDPTLSIYEKGVWQSIYRKMYRGHSVALTRKVICELASVGRSKLILCEDSLQARGMLLIRKTEHAHVFLYQAVRGQFGLFDNRVIVPVENTVKNAVDNNGITAWPASAGSVTVHHTNDHPPDRPYYEHIETQLHTNSNSKPSAEVRPRSSSHPVFCGKKNDQQIEYAIVRQLSYYAEQILREAPAIGLGDLAEEIKTIAAVRSTPYGGSFRGGRSHIDQAIVIATERIKSA